MNPPNTGANHPLQLFAAYGIELEYMIVDARTLNVRPMTDVVLSHIAGEIVNEAYPHGEGGLTAWSNELVSHVIELKVNGPQPSLINLREPFQRDIQHINRILSAQQARMMPGAMHPWMDPDQEMVLWPHEQNDIYDAFNRIFDCRGHGWSNLQSMHINLPFDGDAQFGRLHAAIRLILPLLPALAASSPIVAGKKAAALDQRLAVYRTNARKIPSVSGDVIPEPLFTQHDYQTQLLQRIYADLAPYDPTGILQEEWVNARGAIARFDRNAIEIRVIDVQECPRADLAIAAATVAVLKNLVSERWSSLETQQAMTVQQLDGIFRATTLEGEEAIIDDAHYLRTLGFGYAGMGQNTQLRAQEVWSALIENMQSDPVSAAELAPFNDDLQIMLNEGPLARRILSHVNNDWRREHLLEVYRQMCDCLEAGEMLQSA